MAFLWKTSPVPLVVLWITLTVLDTVLAVQDDDGPVVNTTTGLVRGFSDFIQGTKVDKYLGIPYAEPPLGALRFADPVEKTPWSGTWNATETPPFCACVGMDADDDRKKMAEDCLHLSVFVPEVSGVPEVGFASGASCVRFLCVQQRALRRRVNTVPGIPWHAVYSGV